MPKQFERMSDDELIRYMAGWKEGRPEWIKANEELIRRRTKPDAKRSWVAIAISALALVVAVVALFK